MSGTQLYSHTESVYRSISQRRSTPTRASIKQCRSNPGSVHREKCSESSTPHAPRPKRPGSCIHLQQPIQLATHQHQEQGVLKSLTKLAYDENSPPKAVTVATKQPIGAVMQAWSKATHTPPKIVQPYRRTISRQAPQGVPLLDLSSLNEPDDQLQPVQLLELTTDTYSNRSLISWGEHTHLTSHPNNVKGSPSDGVTPLNNCATTDVEVDFEPAMLDHCYKDTSQSTPSVDKLPQAKALQNTQVEYIEAKLLSHERAKPALMASSSPHTKMPPSLPGVPGSGFHYPPASHPLVHTTSLLVPETSLNKRLRFEARVLTQNGRDVHRELCGFYFLSDNSITIYEYRQFGKKSSALPVIQRGCYTHLIGHRKGDPLEINFIRKGSVLHFRSSEHPCLPSSLRDGRALVALMITNIDEKAKKQLLYMLKLGCRNPVEFSSIETYLNAEPPSEQQRDNLLLSTLQGMLCSCVKGRARKTLVGVGRELRRLASSDGVVSKPHLLQILRTFHLGLTVEDMDRLYQLLVTMEMTPPSGCGLYVDSCVSLLVGRMSEDRLALIRTLYHRVDAHKSGSIALDQCSKFFNRGYSLIPGKGHRLTTDAWDELIECLFGLATSITYADLEHYYQGVSIETDSDSEFYSLLRHCWTL